MIRDYRDHSANERTFLAWVRTGIAVIAFGLVVERFNLFLLAMTSPSLGDASRRAHLDGLIGRLGRYDGLVLIFSGLALVVLAMVRFARTTRMLDDGQTHAASSVRTELIVSAWLMLLVSGYTVYLALS